VSVTRSSPPHDWESAFATISIIRTHALRAAVAFRSFARRKMIGHGIRDGPVDPG
jgi:hypothetical protein